VDYEANRQALIELKNTKLRLQDDRRWERLAKDTGETTRRSLCSATKLGLASPCRWQCASC
jgi:hypothetical protein